ncbi:hypothetical protein [Celeribacter neptunius]|uniref:Uncharacterized protein n=1 Tax=Celeribacter neptunius TaxID=588602 RepID=A0A1I3M2N8_9RHOB|nr:hypothetical protein [Celeribacter neptunius]SFI91005.1 hypothetical protein SAMN04487991_1219 [Celeribacter neptunius]
MAVQTKAPPDAIFRDADYGIVEDLRAALVVARDGDAILEEEMTDRIRDMSYAMTQRLAGYLVRSACGAIDAVIRATDREGSIAFAEHEIEKLENMIWSMGSSSAA